jgi:hypothetical protein
MFDSRGGGMLRFKRYCVQGLLAECAKEKRDAAKKREQTDGEALTQSGKWLTPTVKQKPLMYIVLNVDVLQEQATLTRSIADYFSMERLNPQTKPLTNEGWQFQGHFILHLLNDDVVAVPRSEVLGALRRGTTCVWEKDEKQWLFKVTVNTI